MRVCQEVTILGILGASSPTVWGHDPNNAPISSGCLWTLKTLQKQKTRISTELEAGFWTF
jgi:hypothetical protein